MDTVDRTALDFDLPKICSTTLKSHNVYACLVCGRFFHGRSTTTPAYIHALHDSHYLFLNLTAETFHCLPDDYLVTDPILSDIIVALRPRFTPSDLSTLDKTIVSPHLLDDSTRLRGAVPLDKLHTSNFANVILQLFLRPRPIRDALLLRDIFADVMHPNLQTALVHSMADLCRKLWASHAFRASVAPHVFMQLVAREFAGARAKAAKSDPVLFLAWLLNALTLPKRNSAKTTIQTDTEDFPQLVKQCFHGEMLVFSHSSNGSMKQKSSKFWFLSLDLPPKPLFKNESERELVVQVSLEKLLKKFDRISRHHVVETGEMRSYKVTSLPPFLFLVLRRFTKSKFGMEKNPCVVHLPTADLDLSSVCQTAHSKYRLLGAVSHKGSLEKGDYEVAIFHEASNSWQAISNASVEPTLFQLVSLTDTCVLLYTRLENNILSLNES